MSTVNHVHIVGRLGKDPEARAMPSGTVISTLSVATEEQWKDKQTGEKKKQTEWHRVVLFGRVAEIANQYLKKGAQVYISGRLQTKKWTDKNGIERYTTEIVGANLRMLQSGQDAQKPHQEPQSTSTRQAAPAQADVEEFDDDIPF